MPGGRKGFTTRVLSSNEDPRTVGCTFSCKSHLNRLVARTRSRKERCMRFKSYERTFSCAKESMLPNASSPCWNAAMTPASSCMRAAPAPTRSWATTLGSLPEDACCMMRSLMPAMKASSTPVVSFGEFTRSRSRGPGKCFTTKLVVARCSCSDAPAPA